MDGLGGGEFWQVRILVFETYLRTLKSASLREILTLANHDIAAALRALQEGDFSVRLAENNEKTRDAAIAFNALAEQTERLSKEMSRLCRELGPEGRFGGADRPPRSPGGVEALGQRL